MQQTNYQLALVYLYSQRDEWVVGMMDVQGYGGTEGRTDTEMIKIKTKCLFWDYIGYLSVALSTSDHNMCFTLISTRIGPLHMYKYTHRPTPHV